MSDRWSLSERYPDFCVAPFLEMNIKPNGAVHPCCAFYPSLEENGQIVSVYRTTVEEIWNGQAMRNLRKAWLDGKPPASCMYCKTQESVSPPSIRQELNNGFAGGYGNPHGLDIETLQRTAVENNYKMPDGPSWIDLELGNLCNLACRTCSSGWSSKIANDPVHSQWSTKDLPAPIRWQGQHLSIAPRRGIGFAYEGISGVSQLASGPIAWMDRVASIRSVEFRATLTGVRIRLVAAPGGRLDAPFSLFLNETYVGTSALHEGVADFSIDLNTPVVCDGVFSIRIEVDGPVGIEDLRLKRAEKGRNDVAVGRFAQGKQWFQDEDFLLDELLAKASSLTKITLVGGEPLLIPQTFSILRHLVKHDIAKNIELSLVTNGTIANDEVLELASNFRSSLIGISADGYGSVNNYIRHGSSWEVIEANVSRLKLIPRSHLYVNMVVQAYNMLHISDVIEYVEEMQLGFRYHYMMTPVYLTCDVMPIRARQLAAARLESTLISRGYLDQSKNAGTYADLLNVLKRDVGWPNPGHVQDFMRFTNDLDASRGQSFYEINRELVYILEESGHPWQSDLLFFKMSMRKRVFESEGLEVDTSIAS